MGRPSKPIISKELAARAALTVIDKLGVDGMSLQLVAKELGVKAPSLYYHFKNKQAIIFELFTHYENRVMTVLQLPEERGISTSDKLRYLMETFKGLWEYRFMHRDMESLRVGRHSGKIRQS